MGIIIYFLACGIILPLLVIFAVKAAVNWFDNAYDECEEVLRETDDLIKHPEKL